MFNACTIHVKRLRSFEGFLTIFMPTGCMRPGMSGMAVAGALAGDTVVVESFLPAMAQRQRQAGLQQLGQVAADATILMTL